MEIFQTLGIYALIWSVVVTCVAILLFYSVIRIAVARGLRDHQLWMEKNRPLAGQVPPPRESIGRYFGFSPGPTEPPASGF